MSRDRVSIHLPRIQSRLLLGLVFTVWRLRLEGWGMRLLKWGMGLRGERGRAGAKVGADGGFRGWKTRWSGGGGWCSGRGRGVGGWDHGWSEKIVLFGELEI